MDGWCDMWNTTRSLYGLARPVLQKGEQGERVCGSGLNESLFMERAGVGLQFYNTNTYSLFISQRSDLSEEWTPE